MRKISGGIFLSLDGVMQAPGGPSEDWTGGFEYGGWLPQFFDDALGEAIGGFFSGNYDLLLGRKTYEIFAAHWPYAEGDDAPMGEAFTKAGKYVLTRGDDEFGWANTHKLRDIAAVAELKQSAGPDLIIQGSSTIYPALLEAGLIDEMLIMTFPILLGKGKRPFGDNTPAGNLSLVDHKITPAGIVIARYKPAGPIEIGNFAIAEQSERELARQERMKREG